MRIALFIALIFSAAALALTVYREFEDPIVISKSAKPAVKAETPSDDGLRDELLKLKLRLAALEKVVQRKTQELEPIPQIQEEVAELSTFQNDLAEYALNIDPLDVIGTQEREIENAYSILLDETRSAGERAKQAALLKKYGMFDEEAVASMSNLFFNAESAGEKGAALSALKGHVTPEIRSGVLDSLSTEIADGYQNARFRYQGIEALKPLLPDPEIEAMLTVIAQNDPLVKVANVAGKSVGLPARQEEEKPKKQDG
jgi:hypothetical protein